MRGLLVKEAIKQGFFTRSGKLMRSKEMSTSKKVSEVKAAVKDLKHGDIVGSQSSEVIFPVKENIQQTHSQGA